MTKSLILLCAAALLLPACRDAEPAATNATTADVAADDGAIRGKIDQWLKLVKAKDAAAIAKLYAEDGAVLPPNGPIGKGHAAIEKTWAGMMATPGFDLIFVPEQIVVSSSGDMALDRGTYTLNIAPNGKAMTDTGKYVVVWRKIGGEWEAAADIFNSDLPAAAG